MKDFIKKAKELLPEYLLTKTNSITSGHFTKDLLEDYLDYLEKNI